MKKILVGLLAIALFSTSALALVVEDRGFIKSVNDNFTNKLEYYVILIEGVRILALRDTNGIHTQIVEKTKQQISTDSTCRKCHSR